ncbi:MAG: hypothetical protein KDC90_07070 [Ignavibacteriae bacterium]|nr:hypothetical protein [Ignavibacteriota bacterium]
MLNYKNYSSNFKKNELELVPTKYPNLKKVKLNLTMQSRFIGYVDKHQQTFITTRKIKHLFRKTNSLGLNAKLLTSDTIYFEWIRIEYEGRIYETSREYFMAKGHYFCFQNKGFEAQYFLPLNEFGLDKAIEFRANNGEQGDLFAVAV